MSNTRHAPSGSALHQNRFASSPALASGLLCNLVAKRCTTLERREDREQVFWLQGVDHKEGLKQFVADWLAACPENLGTRSMREFGTKPGKTYNAKEVRQVRGEFPPSQRHHFRLKSETRDALAECDARLWPCDREWVERELEAECDSILMDAYGDGPTPAGLARGAREEAEAAARPDSILAETFLAVCREAALKGLETDLKNLCLDAEETLESGPWYFHDLITRLREYQPAWVEKQLAEFRDGFAPTALSRVIWNQIAEAYQSRGTVLLHNDAADGKSYAAEACGAVHPGQARYVDTPYGNDLVTFLRAIGASIGTAHGQSFKANQIAPRIIEMLSGSGQALVLDTAQWLFPVSDYRYALPVRLNWILQELSKKRVPVVLIGKTKLFETLGLVEKRTDWDRSDFVSQVEVVELPSKLNEKDVLAVAAALLPDGETAAQRKLADLMLVSPGYLHAGPPAAQRARRIAAGHNHPSVTEADMVEALDTQMNPALKFMNAGLEIADAAAAKCKSQVRNWRADTAAQTEAKAARAKGRNRIVTSNDLERASGGQDLTRDSAPVKPRFRASEPSEFSRSRPARVQVATGSAELESADLVAA